MYPAKIFQFDNLLWFGLAKGDVCLRELRVDSAADEVGFAQSGGQQKAMFADGLLQECQFRVGELKICPDRERFHDGG